MAFKTRHTCGGRCASSVAAGATGGEGGIDRRADAGSQPPDGRRDAVLVEAAREAAADALVLRAVLRAEQRMPLHTLQATPPACCVSQTRSHHNMA